MHVLFLFVHPFLVQVVYCTVSLVTSVRTVHPIVPLSVIFLEMRFRRGESSLRIKHQSIKAIQRHLSKVIKKHHFKPQVMIIRQDFQESTVFFLFVCLPRERYLILSTHCPLNWYPILKSRP